MFFTRSFFQSSDHFVTLSIFYISEGNRLHLLFYNSSSKLSSFKQIINLDFFYANKQILLYMLYLSLGGASYEYEQNISTRNR